MTPRPLPKTGSPRRQLADPRVVTTVAFRVKAPVRHNVVVRPQPSGFVSSAT